MYAAVVSGAIVEMFTFCSRLRYASVCMSRVYNRNTASNSFCFLVLQSLVASNWDDFDLKIKKLVSFSRAAGHTVWGVINCVWNRWTDDSIGSRVMKQLWIRNVSRPLYLTKLRLCTSLSSSMSHLVTQWFSVWLAPRQSIQFKWFLYLIHHVRSDDALALSIKSERVPCPFRYAVCTDKERNRNEFNCEITIGKSDSKLKQKYSFYAQLALCYVPAIQTTTNDN